MPQSWSAACKRMRPFLSEVSRKPQFNHVTFVELDVSAESTSVRRYVQLLQAPLVFTEVSFKLFPSMERNSCFKSRCVKVCTYLT